MSEVFLGVIAAAVLVMAVIQVAAVVVAARAARRIDRLANRLEEDMKPVVASLRELTADAARATSLATTQVERTNRLFSELAQRIEEILAAVQDALVAPAKEGVAWLHKLKAVLSAFRDRDVKRPRRSRGTGVDNDDALFIG